MTEEFQKYFESMHDGIFDTQIEGVRIFKISEYGKCAPTVYPASIIVLLSGHKKLHFENRVFTYDPNNYLVVSMTMPAVCETCASVNEPVQGIVIDLDLKMLRELIDLMDIKDRISGLDDKCQFVPIGPSAMDELMQQSCQRLLNAIKDPCEARILGKALKREVTFRALCGGQSQMLIRLASLSGAIAKVSSIIELMQENYNQPLDVDDLAKKSNLSVSSFYRLFKSITSDTPIQYLKKIRLNKARDLIVTQNVKSYVAAVEVGYESVSQFSREFKRYFGETPASLKAN